MFTTVAILGASSRMGEAWATGLVSSACSLRLYDQQEAGAQLLAWKLKQLTPLADVEALSCSATASWEADLVILAMPLAAQADAARRIAAFVTQKTVCSVVDQASGSAATAMAVLAELQCLLPHSTIRLLPGTPAHAGSEPLPAQDAAWLLEQLRHAETPPTPERTS
jgi:hypothetical protein